MSCGDGNWKKENPLRKVNDKRGFITSVINANTMPETIDFYHRELELINSFSIKYF